MVIDFNLIRLWEKRACFVQKEVIRYYNTTFVTRINYVPSYSIFSFTTNLMAFKSNSGRVSENFSPRNVLLICFLVAVQQL